ncbi:hypothetical protein EDD18DRAFT_1387137 [Armillaria luteobubalina]|uniref:Uncharacterized protein n=1 Tax=Armillaria luteobubalina TaxID=153913 RepID=A0AA39P1R0_9AGAR|nr:hypothetical protein EDD18DRAFT_1387137 [Armillaria luteobubalina]
MSDDILCGDQRHVLMQNTSYTAHREFLNAHEWVRSGSADIVADALEAHAIDGTERSNSAKIIVVGRVMANPRLLKLGNVGNYNDRFMRLYHAKWVLHLSKPMHTLFERDWEESMHHLLALEERVATTKGVNMLIHHEEDGSINLRMTAPCFVSNTVEEDDPALKRYMRQVDHQYEEDMKELNPWWKLNILKITNAKGKVIPPGASYSMEGSLVEVTFTIKHYYISTSKTDSFSAIISSARIMVSGLRREEAKEAYDSFIKNGATTDAPVGVEASSSVISSKDVDEGTTATLTSESEEGTTSRGIEKGTETEMKEDLEDDNSRKRKGRGGTERSAKKAKTHG